MSKFQRRLLAGVSALACVTAAPALAQTYNVGSGSTTTVTNVIADGASATSVTITGDGSAAAGTVILTNTANSYSGGTTVNGNANLQLTASSVAGATTSQLGNLTGALNLGDGTYSGAVFFNNTAPSTLAQAINLTGQGGPPAIGGIISTTSSALTLSGLISGSGALVVTGGNLILTNTGSSYSGGTIIEGGASVSISTDTNLGATTSSIILGDPNKSGTLILTTTDTYTTYRAIQIDAGGGFLTGNSNAVTFAGAISGVGSLTINGGTIILAPGVSNTYGANTTATTVDNVTTVTGVVTGSTNVIGGATLEVGSNGALGFAPATGVAGASVPLNLGDATSQGTLDLTNTSAVTSARVVTIGAAGATIDTTTATAAWTFTGNVGGANAGLLTTGGTGRLVLDGQNNLPGGLAVIGGTTQIGDASTPKAELIGNATVSTGGVLAGYGTITGSVTNNGGTVQPGGTSGTTGPLTVASYTQSNGSTLSVEISTSGASVLKVVGGASLAGGLALNFQNGQYTNSTYTLLTAGGGVTGTFSTLPPSISLGLTETVTYLPGAVELTLTQNKTLPETPTVYTAMTSTAIDEMQAVSGTVLSRLSQARGQAYADGLHMATSDYHRAGLGSATPYGSWVQAIGGFGTTNGSGGVAGYSQNGGGMVTGVDAAIGNGGAIGIAVGYTRNGVTEQGGAHGTIDTPYLGVYGGYWLGNFAVDGTIGYGAVASTVDRPIAVLGSTAQTNRNANAVSAGVQVSGTFDVAGIVLVPAIGTQYLLLAQGSSSESGAGAYDLTTDTARTNALRSFVSATASTRYEIGVHSALIPEIKVAYQENSMGTDRQVGVRPVDDAQSFVFDGVSQAKSNATLNLGLTLETSKDLGFYVNAQTDHSSNGNSESFGAGMRYRF